LTGSPRILPLGPAHAYVAAALHGEIGFPRPWDQQAFANLFALPSVQGLAAVFEDETAPAGLALWQVAADEAELLTIGIVPGRRGAGLGRFLLAASCAAMREAGAMRCFLEVADDNIAARTLYERCGFAIVGRRAAYYRTDDGTADALIMERDLRVMPNAG
jgi:[ribosomal protein S18]-alanine N-acetyltransferase